MTLITLSHYYYEDIPVNFFRTSSPIKLHANRTSAVWRLSNTLSDMSMLIHLCISFHNDVIISFLMKKCLDAIKTSQYV